MSSTKDYLDFVLEQLSDLPDITYRAIMGEYIIYYHGKIIGGIYDNRLLVKPINAAKVSQYRQYLSKVYNKKEDL